MKKEIYISKGVGETRIAVKENGKLAELHVDKESKERTVGNIYKGVVENALKKAFAPEFLNRIDDVIVFNALEKHDIDLIIEIELKKLYARIKDLGYELNLSDTAKAFIADKGFDKQFGARPLKRAIQKYVEDALAEEIITSKIGNGDEIFMDLDETTQELVVKVTKAPEPTNQ